MNGKEYLPSELSLLGPGMISVEAHSVSRAWGSAGDYHLQSGSPAIDAGTALGSPSRDLDGKQRPAGSGVDIGAYER